MHEIECHPCSKKDDEDSAAPLQLLLTVLKLIGDLARRVLHGLGYQLMLVKLTPAETPEDPDPHAQDRDWQQQHQWNEVD